MIRQAHSYFLGAMSGTALIAGAVVVFVVLVSAQAFKDWPISALGGGFGESAPLAPGKPVAHGEGGTAASSAPKQSQAQGKHNGDSKGGAPSRGTAHNVDSVGATGGSTHTGAGSSPPAGSTGGSAGGSPTGAGSSAGSGSTGAGSSQPSGGGNPGSEVTNTVNDTVSGAGNTIGGALEGAGVPKAAEEIVNGAAGPESVVGQTAEKAGETVGGLLTPPH